MIEGWWGVRADPKLNRLNRRNQVRLRAVLSVGFSAITTETLQGEPVGAGDAGVPMMLPAVLPWELAPVISTGMLPAATWLVVEG